MRKHFNLTFLGQTGFIIDFEGVRLVIDPYLSDYVGRKYGSELTRAVEIPMLPEEITGVEIILITHEHEDHCDPITLTQLHSRNKNVSIVCPLECNQIIKEINFKKIINPKINQVIEHKSLSIKSLPSCHTSLEINSNYSRYLGYLIKFDGFTLYHPGDTIPFDTKDYLPESIDLAFLPINERNYFRESLGLIGNMTCREALSWSKSLNVKRWIPTHWDLFESNSTFKEELDILSDKLDIRNYQWMDIGNSLEVQI